MGVGVGIGVGVGVGIGVGIGVVGVGVGVGVGMGVGVGVGADVSVALSEGAEDSFGEVVPVTEQDASIRMQARIAAQKASDFLFIRSSGIRRSSAARAF